jgi:predicted PurR-regulated permease PerM
MSMTPNIVRRTTACVSTIASKPIVIILIIAAIVLVVFLLYTQIQVGNESYKIENYEALWNQSLANFRSGNTTIDEYCINRVHDEDFCNRFMSLQYFN